MKLGNVAVAWENERLKANIDCFFANFQLFLFSYESTIFPSNKIFNFSIL